MEQTGLIHHWRSANGYGFILPDVPGDDVFLHFRALPEGEDVKKGDRVRFVAEQSERGLRAVRATII